MGFGVALARAPRTLTLTLAIYIYICICLGEGVPRDVGLARRARHLAAHDDLQIWGDVGAMQGRDGGDIGLGLAAHDDLGAQPMSPYASLCLPMMTLAHSARASSSSVQPSNSAAAAAAACEEGDSLSRALASWVECWVEVKSICPRCNVAATTRQWRSTGSSPTPQPSIVARAWLGLGLGLG